MRVGCNTSQAGENGLPRDLDWASLADPAATTVSISEAHDQRIGRARDEADWRRYHGRGRRRDPAGQIVVAGTVADIGAGTRRGAAPGPSVFIGQVFARPRWRPYRPSQPVSPSRRLLALAADRRATPPARQSSAAISKPG